MHLKLQVLVHIKILLILILMNTSVVVSIPCWKKSKNNLSQCFLCFCFFFTSIPGSGKLICIYITVKDLQLKQNNKGEYNTYVLMLQEKIKEIATQNSKSKGVSFKLISVALNVFSQMYWNIEKIFLISFTWWTGHYSTFRWLTFCNILRVFI